MNRIQQATVTILQCTAVHTNAFHSINISSSQSMALTTTHKICYLNCIIKIETATLNKLLEMVCVIKYVYMLYILVPCKSYLLYYRLTSICICYQEQDIKYVYVISGLICF